MSGLVARVIGSLLSSPAEERHFLSFQPASNAFWSIPSMITRIKYTARGEQMDETDGHTGWVRKFSCSSNLWLIDGRRSRS